MPRESVKYVLDIYCLCYTHTQNDLIYVPLRPFSLGKTGGGRERVRLFYFSKVLKGVCYNTYRVVTLVEW